MRDKITLADVTLLRALDGIQLTNYYERFDYDDYKQLDFTDEETRKLYRIAMRTRILVRPYTNDICLIGDL